MGTIDNSPAIHRWDSPPRQIQTSPVRDDRGGDQDHLSTQSAPIVAFVQELDGNWYYRGQFKVTGHSSDPNEISVRKVQANRNDVYKVIFLQEV